MVFENKEKITIKLYEKETIKSLIDAFDREGGADRIGGETYTGTSKADLRGTVCNSVGRVDLVVLVGLDILTMRPEKREGDQMMKHGFKIIDSDMHIIEPPEMWEKYIDGVGKDRAPKIVGSYAVPNRWALCYEFRWSEPGARGGYLSGL
jgi:hypothetical protein